MRPWPAFLNRGLRRYARVRSRGPARACRRSPRSSLRWFVAEAPTQALAEAAPDAGAVIAATKLHIPAPREGLVPRTALVAALADPGARKLTLLAAPPGSGKTTLLSEWRASPREERPFAWLSLDSGDNDPVRFWAGVIEALRTVEPDLRTAAL